MRCMVLRLIAMRPEGPAVRSPGRKAGEAPGRGKREYRRRALKARYFIQSAGVTAAPSALISQLQPNPGLTAGSTYCRPLGPQTNSVAILRQSRAVAHGYLYFFSILLGPRHKCPSISRIMPRRTAIVPALHGLRDMRPTHR